MKYKFKEKYFSESYWNHLLNKWYNIHKDIMLVQDDILHISRFLWG